MRYEIVHPHRLSQPHIQHFEPLCEILEITQEFDYKLKHVPEKENYIANTMSRMRAICHEESLLNDK